MTLEPLLAAGPAIQIHTAAALLAVVLTPVQLLAGKGTAVHRTSGYLWALAMLVVALSSFWIHTIRVVGPWSPIHLLSVWVVAMLPLALLAARRGRVRTHRNAMIAFVVGALLIAGGFTLMPGRIMHGVLFGG
ncbi:DUF2306 domain-containing protein [Stappia sp.]|uniref:DUF2306 domain-containing protein n=1 Tax=Stappia sp. TaxID=1870903 RepID=UPI0032D94BE3